MTATGRAVRGSRITKARAGLNKIFGFGLSMLFLAIASLAAIPAMVTASGAHSWGMIAAGQAVGSVAAVAIFYGWGMSGPATIARADAPARLAEYVESVISRLILCVPIGLVAVVIAWSIGGDLGLFSAVGALSTASVGFTANWYFVGRSQPYTLFVCETVPRVAGTGVGIVFMVTGSSALIGVLWQLIGMLIAFAVSSVWITKPWRLQQLRAVRHRPVLRVLWAQRHGLTASLLTSIYSAAPIAIVTIFAPIVQPVYAVVDKVQRQVNVGLTPFTSVMQGWVPRAPRGALYLRVRQAVTMSLIFSGVLSGFMFVIAPELIGWLGGGQIHPSVFAMALMAVITGFAVFESIVSRACLTALGRLDVAARATVIGAAVGLPLVAIGAVNLGAEGALVGILIGLALRLGIELVTIWRARIVTQEASHDAPIGAQVEVDER